MTDENSHGVAERRRFGLPEKLHSPIERTSFGKDEQVANVELKRRCKLLESLQGRARLARDDLVDMPLADPSLEIKSID